MARMAIGDDLFRLGLIEGVNSHFGVVDKFGYNSSVPTTWEDIWTVSGNMTYLAAEATLTITSTSVEDDPVKADVSAGTGAFTMTIQGLDGNYLEIEEDLTLNGTAGVTTANKYLRVYRMFILTAGTGGANAGTISAKSGATVLAEIGLIISLGMNQTLMTHYTVPAGKTAYFRQLHFNVGKSADADGALFIRPPGEVFQCKFIIKGFQSDVFHDNFRLALKAEEKSDIKMMGVTSAGTQEVAAGWQAVLVDNTFTFNIPTHLS